MGELLAPTPKNNQQASQLNKALVVNLSSKKIASSFVNTDPGFPKTCQIFAKDKKVSTQLATDILMLFPFANFLAQNNLILFCRLLLQGC